MSGRLLATPLRWSRVGRVGSASGLLGPIAATIVAIAATLTVAPSAHAIPPSSCEPLTSADQEARADAIVEGEVLDVTLGPTAAVVRVGVRRVVKGAPPAELLLEASLPGEGVAGEVPFDEGWPHWLLYLRETTPGSGRWYTSLCDGSRPIPPP